MTAILEHVPLRDPSAVIDALTRGTAACLSAACRRGWCERVELSPGDPQTSASTLIATGDLHDNPLHMARVVRAAGIEEAWAAHQAGDRSVQPTHLTLHELIHGDRLTNGMDFSYRVLVRAAVLKAAFPERVHVLLANHELAQMTGAQVAKDGIRYNQAFDDALESTFGPRWEAVRGALHGFVRALPLAVRFRTSGIDGDVFCSHSLPNSMQLPDLDPSILDRTPVDADFLPRTGLAHQLTWGRGHSPADILLAASKLNARLFLLGHEKAESGWHVVSPRALILNSDHENGVFLRHDLRSTLQADELAWHCTRLSEAS